MHLVAHASSKDSEGFRCTFEGNGIPCPIEPGIFKIPSKIRLVASFSK